MSKTREQKEHMVEAYTENLKNMKAAAIVSVQGYTISDADILREKGREAGVEFMVTKKTLMNLAVQKAGITNYPETLQGSLLWGFGYSDEVSPAKLLSDLLKKKKEMEFLGGVLEGSFIGSLQIKQLASLPSKQELLAKLVGSIHAPVSGLVHVLAGNLQGLVRVISAIKEQKV